MEKSKGDLGNRIFQYLTARKKAQGYAICALIRFRDRWIFRFCENLSMSDRWCFDYLSREEYHKDMDLSKGEKGSFENFFEENESSPFDKFVKMWYIGDRFT